jgi:hypothetical protein
MRNNAFILLVLTAVCCTKNDTRIENDLIGTWTTFTLDTVKLSDTLSYIRLDTIKLSFDESQLLINSVGSYIPPLDSLEKPPYNLHFFTIKPPPYEYTLLADDTIEVRQISAQVVERQAYYKYSLVNDSLCFTFVYGNGFNLGGPDSILLRVYVRSKN